MTSNQVAAASNKVTNEHLQRYDAEITRHNSETEKLQSQINDIEKQRADETQRHNEKMEWFENANQTFKATEILLNDYRQQENIAIARGKAGAEAQRLREQTELDTRELELRSRLADEQARHNLYVEQLDKERNLIQAQMNVIQDTYNKESVAVDMKRNYLNEIRMSQDYERQRLAQDLDIQKTKLEALRTQAEVNLKKKQELESVTRSINNLVESLDDLHNQIKNFIPY